MFQISTQVKRIFIGVFVLFFLTFVLFQYRAQLMGPSLGEGNFRTFLSLREADIPFHLRVPVRYTESATLNGRPLFLKHETHDGVTQLFIDEKLFFPTPYSEGIIVLKDKFGKTKSYPFFVWVERGKSMVDSEKEGEMRAEEVVVEE